MGFLTELSERDQDQNFSNKPIDFIWDNPQQEEGSFYRQGDASMIQKMPYKSLLCKLMAWRRDIRQQDNVVVITGERGKGKSETAVYLAEVMEKDFDVSTNLFFNVADFHKRMGQLNHDTIILDEASLGIDSRSWWTVESKLINSLLMRSRYRKNNVIMTFPNIAELDLRTRGYIAYRIMMDGVDHKRKEAKARVYRFKLDDFKGKPRHEYVQHLRIPPITPLNRKKYIELKLEFNAMLDERDSATLDYLNDPENLKKPLSRDSYFKAFKTGVLTESDFRTAMARVGLNYKDTEMLIKMKPEPKDNEELETIEEPPTQEQIDLDEFMNEKQKMEIKLMEESLREKQARNSILLMEREKKEIELEKVMNESDKTT